MRKFIKIFAAVGSISCAMISANAYAAVGNFQIHSDISKKYARTGAIAYKVTGPNGEQTRGWTYIKNQSNSGPQQAKAGSVVSVQILALTGIGPKKNFVVRSYHYTVDAHGKLAVRCSYSPGIILPGETYTHAGATCQDKIV